MSTARAGPAGARVAGPVLVGALVAALVATRWETAVLALAVAVLTAAFIGARMPGNTWWAGFAAGAVFALALNTWLTPGRPLAGVPSLFGHAATGEGLSGGVLVILRMLGALAAVQGLRALLPGDAAADAFARALAPLERAGLPVGNARAILGLSARVVPMLRDEWTRVARVQRLRAGRPPRGVAARMHALRASAVPALTGALERADRVALALEARHYRVRPLAPPGTRRSGASLAGWGVAAALVATCALWRG